MKSVLNKAAKAGRFGDDQLIHVSRHEIKGLESLLPPGVKELPRNPDTGLKEAFFFLPLLLGAAAAAAPAAAAAAPIAAGLGATALGAAGAAALPAAATAATGLGALGAAGTAALPAAAAALPAATAALPAATSGLGALGGATAAMPALPAVTSAIPTSAASLAPLASTPAALGGAAPGAISMPAAAAALPATAPIPTAAGGAFGGSAATAGGMAPATAFGGSAATASGAPAAGGGLGGMLGGVSSNQLMTGLGLMSLMGKMGGGSSSSDSKKKDVSKDKYNGGDPVFPSDGGASGGTGPEWNYFPNSNFYNNGGVVAMAGGGKVPSAKGNDQSLIKETVAAIQGQAADPQQIIARFVKAFGQQALSDLMNKLKGSAGGQAAPPMQASGLGALQGGGGDGMSDSIPASISGQNGQQPAALSEGEYVVPADAVSGLGNGSTNAGSRALDHMVGNVRQMKTGGKVQPPAIKASHVTGFADGGPVGAPPAPAGGMAFNQGLGSFNAGFNGLAARMAGGMGQGPAMNTGLGAPMGQPQAGQWSGQMIRPAPLPPQPVYTPAAQPVAPAAPTNPMAALMQHYGMGGGNGGGARGASSGGNGNGWGGH